MNTINMNIVQGTQETAQYEFQLSDGKNLGEVMNGMEWVRISEKKIGKGKGKTIAAISLPTIDIPNQLFADAFTQARKEMLTMMHRAGKKAIGEQDADLPAVIRWYAAQSFSVDSIGEWFREEMSVYLRMNICAAKGWNEAELSEEQTTYIDTKLASYAAAFLECGAKFPKLAPAQRAELIRVIGINELSGGIVDKIMSKLEVKETVEEALGF